MDKLHSDAIFEDAYVDFDELHVFGQFDNSSQVRLKTHFIDSQEQT